MIGIRKKKSFGEERIERSRMFRDSYLEKLRAKKGGRREKGGGKEGDGFKKRETRSSSSRGSSKRATNEN
jgi:hypothetical protein